jgi:hypothetical protein
MSKAVDDTSILGAPIRTLTLSGSPTPFYTINM